MACRIINRTNGQLILPDNRILRKNSSLIVNYVDNGLREMEQKGTVSIHSYEPTICNADWCSYMVDASCSSKKAEILPGFGPKFKPNEQTTLDFKLQLPFNYLPHSPITPTLQWIIVGSGKEGYVVWKIDYYAISNGKVISGYVEILAGITITDTGTVTTVFKEIDSEKFYERAIVQGVLYRDGTDERDTFQGVVVPSLFELKYQLKPKQGNRLFVESP